MSNDIHWSYRVVVKDVAGEQYSSIREVYFSNSGDIVSWSEPITPIGVSTEYPMKSIMELRDILEMMEKAFYEEHYSLVVLPDGEEYLEPV